MKPKVIILLLTIFALAAAGLTALQIVQSNRTAAISNNLFTINVNNTMEDVIDQLNRMKVEDFISQKDRYKLLKLRRIEDLNAKMNTVIREHSNLFYDTTHIRLNVALKDSALITNHIGLSVDDLTAISNYNTLLATRNKLTNGSDFYEHILNDVSEYVVNTMMSSANFNYQMLDSLITEELLTNGIDIKHYMGVINSRNNELIYCNHPGKESRLLETPYRYDFSPSGLVGVSDYYILLQFPSSLRFLKNSNNLVLISGTILLLIIVILFIIATRIIINQKKLDEMKNDFISNMTHEIKTPITNISLACEMLAQPDIADNTAMRDNFINMITNENKRMLILVQTILQSSKMTSKNYTLHLTPIDINDTIRDVAQNFDMQIANRQGAIHLDLQADPATLYVDELHITNMLYNLIDNAIKYSPSRVDITITTHTTDNQCIITVADQGQGISKEDQAHIFEKFYRVPTGDIHNVKGFGIGLNYVAEVVRLHGGTIHVDSTLGQGSCFTITLPLSQPPAPIH